VPALRRRLSELRAMKEAESKKPGFQRLRIMQYDELRRKLTSSQGLTVGREAVRAVAVDAWPERKRGVAFEFPWWGGGSFLMA
jgi:hypothetical protein